MADNKTNKERLKEITDGIEQGIKELFQSDRYRSYLSVMSRFHRYSVNNTMLIYLQRPNASLVAGFNKWEKQFGRHVKRGEHGITIIAPTPFKKKIEEVKLDPDTQAPLLDKEGKQIVEEKEISIPMFKPVKVFDVAQTYGKPLPVLAEALSGTVEQYEVFVEALRRSAQVPIFFKAIEPNTDGFFSPSEQSITIREGMGQVQTVCAMFHEIAHSKLHNYEKQAEAAAEKDGAEPVKKKDRNTEEVEAESISYAVCQYYGIETAENSFGYIATWSEGKELKELRASLETINRTASELITDIDRNFKEICKERGIDPKALTEQAPEQEMPAPEPPDAYLAFTSDLCDYLERLYKEEKLDRPFFTMSREDAASGLAEMLRKGGFDGSRKILSDAAERSGEAAPETLVTRLEALSDQWDKSLTFRLEPGILQDGNSYVMASAGEGSQSVLFTGPTEVCKNLLNELNEGSMTARQVRELNRQWEEAGQTPPLGEPEILRLLDKAQILHIQTTDEGFDYTLYDADSFKLIDGGRISEEAAKMHPSETLMEGAFKEVCIRQGLEPKKTVSLPLEMLEEIEADSGQPPVQEKQKDEPEQADLPDPAITPEMMNLYGYADEDMLPLSRDRALELAEKDVTIYLLYQDGTESMAFDEEEIVNHDGIFGVTRDEWDSIKTEIPPRDVEKRFMENPRDAFVIYQLRDDAPRERFFASLDSLPSAPDRAQYEPVYTSDLTYTGSTGDKLEGLYQDFNLTRPGDFCGHSLSVSDILALKQDGEVSYHYCDSIGFQELPDFRQPENYLKTAELSTEDDYGMIDGILNNGPRQPGDTECRERKNEPGRRASVERKPSVLEQLKQPVPKQPNKTAPNKRAEKEI